MQFHKFTLSHRSLQHTHPPRTTMRAAQANAFGPAATVLTVSDDIPPPHPPTPSQLLIRVYAVSLSPSDYRMLSGDASLFKKPRHGFPYVPGGDVSGIVLAVHAQAKHGFKTGDRVLATWDTFGEGALAEFALVRAAFTVRLPRGWRFDTGAAVANSAANSLLAVEEARIACGERVLVLGGGGGVGNGIVQLAKLRGAYVVATCAGAPELVHELGAECVVNYREENWWQQSQFLQAPFDVLVDCAEGVVAWERACESGVVKCGRQGGRFLALVVNEWHIVVKTVWDMIKWFAPVVGRMVGSFLRRERVPKYRMMLPAPGDGALERVIELVDKGDFKVVLDPMSPWPFTTEGVRAAFDVMTERRAHGKVVIQVREEEA